MISMGYQSAPARPVPTSLACVSVICAVRVSRRGGAGMGIARPAPPHRHRWEGRLVARRVEQNATSWVGVCCVPRACVSGVTLLIVPPPPPRLRAARRPRRAGAGAAGWALCGTYGIWLNPVWLRAASALRGGCVVCVHPVGYPAGLITLTLLARYILYCIYICIYMYLYLYL